MEKFFLLLFFIIFMVLGCTFLYLTAYCFAIGMYAAAFGGALFWVVLFFFLARKTWNAFEEAHEKW